MAASVGSRRLLGKRGVGRGIDGGFFAGGREFDPKTAASTGLRFNTGTSAHSFNAFHHDGQPNARAGIIFNAMQALEDMEDSLMVRWINSDSVVLNEEADFLAVGFGPDLDVGNDATGDEL